MMGVTELDTARRYAQAVGTELVMEKRALQARIAADGQRIEALQAIALEVMKERDSMKQWGLDRLAEKQAEIDGYLQQVTVLTTSIAMTKDDWRELVELRRLIGALPKIDEDVRPQHIVAYIYVGREQIGLVEPVEALLKHRVTKEAA